MLFAVPFVEEQETITTAQARMQAKTRRIFKNLFMINLPPDLVYSDILDRILVVSFDNDELLGNVLGGSYLVTDHY